MNEFYLVDAVFLAKRAIRSLPEFHGARWSAWLRYACQRCGLAPDSIVLGLMPLRNGQNPIEAGEALSLRLAVRDPDRLGLLGCALGNTAPHGEFSSQSLELLFWQEAAGGRKHPPASSPQGMQPLALEAVKAEISLLASLDSFSLKLHCPLRLPLPAGFKRKDAGVERYCPPAFFSQGNAIHYLAQKVRFWQWVEHGANRAEENLAIAGSGLAWRDMRYNQARRIALGGVTGEIRCQGTPGWELAKRLVLGQYLGAGKNPLFGLGYWIIPELSEARQISLEQGTPHG